MLKPIVYITITTPKGDQSLEFDFVNEVQLVRSRKNLTATCTIKFPRKLMVLNGDINVLLKRGSRVVVKMGYGKELITEFIGYIAKVGAKMPIEISCEDEMWHLKQNTNSKAWKNTTLKEVIKYVYHGPAIVTDSNLGGFVIKKQSTAQVFELLKSKHGVRCYFNSEGVLIAEVIRNVKVVKNGNVGLNRVKYDFNVNVIDNDLEYVINDNIRIKVNGISKLPTGKIIEFSVGDEDGKVIPLNFRNISKEELEENVKKEFEHQRKNGYTKSFKTFGAPYVEPGYVAIMEDQKYKERSGDYLIEAVTVTFGTAGFRRQITLEKRLA